VAYRSEPDDPFGTQRTPALSWKGLPVGSVFVLTVLEPAKLLHSRNFETNRLDYWDAERTQPIMSAVVNVRVVSGPHSVGEERSVWAQKPSNLFAAIAEAQRVAESRMLPGGTLAIRFAGEVPHENKRYSPIKQYEARYTPPLGGAGPDPFHGQQTPGASVQGPNESFPVPTTTTPPAGAAAGQPAKPRW